MKGFLKVMRILLLIIVSLALIATTSGYIYLRQSLPQVSGRAKLSGLHAPIDVMRDIDGIPHIYAQNELDAFMGLGYVHAQDRLWQMEFQRRVAQGRLAEILGPPVVSLDKFLRTLGIYRAAQATWATLPATTKDVVNAYIGGINGFIVAHPGAALPPEFTILRAVPEPWTGPDVIAWAKMMAWDLGGGFESELLRATLLQTVGAERAQQLLPPYPDEALTILRQTSVARGPLPQANRSSRLLVSAPKSNRYESLLTVTDQLRAFAGIGGLGKEGIGSNNWVVDGTKSITGKPLLASDPHLGAGVPSIWYLAHLSGGGLDVIGATMAGLPMVIIGRNQSIAWGMTNLKPDVLDLFREHLDPTGQQFEFQGQMEPIQVITETIKVNGQPDIQLPVRLTRHGPLISDVINETNETHPANQNSAEPETFALRWTGLETEDNTVGAFINLNKAQSWDEFKQALRDYVAPAQNFVYADESGNIGYFAPGKFPMRAGGDGAFPAEGWTGTTEWQGWVPFDLLPQAYNPPEHMIVTANNRPVGAEYPYYLGQEWLTPYRAQRITDLLQAKSKLSLDDMAAIQGDQISLLARALLPKLLKLVTPQNDAERRAVQILSRWDGDSTGSSVAAAIFQVWLAQLPEAILDDELGSSVLNRYQWWVDSYVGRFLEQTLADPQNVWCDQTTTAPREDCAQVTTHALGDALAELEIKMGSNMEAWHWEQLHTVVFRHQPFDQVPVLASLFSRQAVNGGDWSTVNVGNFRIDSSFEQFSIPGYRQLIDLSDRENGRFIQAVGQSGHVLSSHYDQYLADWQNLRYRPMRFERATVERSQPMHLQLEPQRRS